MRRAAVFMDEHVSHRGAYVWSCLPDLPLTWGEMEARCTMCWVQPPFSGAVTQTPWPDERPSWLPSDVGHGMEDGDYTRHVTFNDDELAENIKFLLV